MRLEHLASGLALLVALTGCSGDDSSKKSSSTPQLDFSAFDSAVSQFLVDNGLTGASAVIVHKDWGVVHTMGYGAYPPDRTYLIASSSKELSVGVLMRLADQGKLDIDAPIGNYVSAWGAPGGTFTPPKSALKVAELVSNSSGLISLTDNPLYGPYICQYSGTGTLTDCGKAVYTADDTTDPVSGAVRVPPDTKFRYGGGQWQLAGAIAEVVGGKPWADLIRETYVDPCGTPSIGFGNQFFKAFSSGGPDGGSVASALAYPAFFQSNPANLDPTQDPSIEGGAYTTVEDYGKILLMHLRGGLCGTTRVLSDAAVKRMQVDRIASYGGSTLGGSGGGLDGYGMGWWVDRTHPGVVADPGAYGAMPWLDDTRAYGAFIALESDAGKGMQLYTIVKPLADAVFDGATH